ncbi:MAG: flavodoxin family protein [Thermoproteota archaeon]
MVKLFVIYDTKYGNTRCVAEKIVEGMSEVEEIEPAISDVEHVDLEKVAECDVILIGLPNHMGRPTRAIGKFIDKLGKVYLKARWVAVFDTYMGGDLEKAVKKMEKRIRERVLGLELIASGLSIRVGGIKGPIMEGEIPKCKDFGKKTAIQLKSG